ncbi:hypothetical protein C8J57DRAFT_1226969 [Mycena rebaudengoi]|nr:hypothetical protein C8J57DRAFT_1226969 [Mycena rebaudengoi]
MASGLALQSALGHDFVLRRNIRIAFEGKVKSTDPFVLSTFGSHHIALVDHTAAMWNDLLAAPGTSAASLQLQPLPRLQDIKSGETFGLVKSAHTNTFGGLFITKPEPEDDSQLINEALDPEEHENFMQELKIDAAELLQPLKPPNLRSASLITSTHLLGPTNPSPPFSASSRMMDTAVRTDIDTNSMDIASSGLKRKQLADTASAPHPPQTAPVTASVIPPNIANLKALTTGIDPRSEFQWRSFSMTPTKWVTETVLYTERLLKRESDAVQKNPRALCDKLGEVEPVIVKRITNSEYKSKAGSTKFWEKHCNAVSLVKTESNDESVPQDGSIANAVKQRKPQTCTRCKTIKYPGPAGSPENHKKASCSDGFKPTLSGDTVPIWPLPSGIFTAGTKFHPLVFLAQVRELYQRLVLDQVSAVDLSLEEDAFFTLVKSRVVVNPDNGAVLFKMFKDFDIPAGDLVPDDLIVEYDGTKHLYISSPVDTDLLSA